MGSDIDIDGPPDIEQDDKFDTADAKPPGSGWRRNSLVFLGYLAASLWFWRDLLPHLATRTLGHGQMDPGQFIWWLNWTPYALKHGLYPLHTTFLDAPTGVSAMWNTSVVALGVVFAPITVTVGPVASFNLACILGPPLSAFTAWCWLRRHASDGPAAIGGLVFGFSPFVIGHSLAGHLNFTWLFLLPIIAMLVEDSAWRAPRPFWPQAPLLGIVISVQLLLGAEALLIMSFLCAGTLLVLAATNVPVARRRWRVFVGASTIALGVAVALCALPLIEQFGGARSITEPVQELGGTGGSMSMLVGATRALRFHTGIGPIGHLTAVENGLYIGWPLLLLLATAAVLLWRRPGVLIAVGVVVGAVTLQMYGTFWHIAGLRLRLPLRFLQDQLPVARNILPGRLAIAMWFAIAWLLAVGLDAALHRRQGAARVLVYATVVVCLVPLTPGHSSPPLKLLPVPALFSSSLRNTIPDGATVMVAPMATVQDSEAELWQIESGMRFRQLGGFALHAINAGRTPSYYPDTTSLRTLYSVDPVIGAYPGRVTPEMLSGARKELRDSHASMFLVGPSIGVTRHLQITHDLLLRPPDRTVGGVAIWDLHPSG